MKVKEKKKRNKTDLIDQSIQGTNDSSITSKRSVEKLYWNKGPVSTGVRGPEFFRHFVPKFQRRSPIINRGYWTRMEAIKKVINKMIQGPFKGKKVVVNLGCGFDPYPFELMAQKGLDTVFLDIDYTDLIEKKVSIILNSELKNSLGEVLTLNLPTLKSTEPKANESQYSDPLVLLETPQYIALGCDLRNMLGLQTSFESLFCLENTLFLFTAEVSMTYMDQTSADNLIQWTASLPNAEFALLEQIMPAGKDHPFAKVMLKHFNSLQTPLHSISSYPTKNSQKSRFMTRGWCDVKVQNLFEFWNNDVEQSQKDFVESVEDFDEWEEFILFCQHYFVLHASNFEVNGRGDDTVDQKSRGCEKWPLLSIDFVSRPLERKFSAGGIYNDKALMQHGGMTTSRSSSLVFLSKDSNFDPYVAYNSIESRVCHSLTKLTSGAILLVGGRTSPSSPLKDCWLLRGQQWTRVHDLPDGRYRHCCVCIGDDKVLLFGGTHNDHAAVWLLWSEKDGWQSLDNYELCSRESAALAWDTNKNYGILIGGMSKGNILSDCHRVCVVDGKTITTSKILNHNLLNRYGSKCLFTDNGKVLLAGGVSSLKLLDRSDSMILIDPQSATIIALTLNSEVLLVGFNMDFLNGSIAIYGGGAVCFSFGSFWSPTILLTLPHDKNNHIDSITDLVDIKNSLVAYNETRTRTILNSFKQLPTDVKIAEIGSKDDFTKLCREGMPFVMSNINLGPCTTLWKDSQYIVDKVGKDRQVIAHVSNLNSLNFAKRNFEYQIISFGKFIATMYSGKENVYFRSLSSDKPKDKPAYFINDFPSLAPDFKLPFYLESIMDNHFSSPLRLSSKNTSMWLHYDVTANILCQIVGEKRVRLYPPCDVNKLSFQPGASSSTIENIFEKDDIPGTHAIEIIMKPGDVIYIPSMWLHATCPLSESISLNFFWKDLEGRIYAPGKDIYGNSDIDAYQKGRIAVEKIKEAFSGVPDDIKEFYILRLSKELALDYEQTK